MKAAPVADFAVVPPACVLQGEFPADDCFRARENIVGPSGHGAGFTNQQRKGE